MGAAPYVIAIISAWAVVATILAARHRHGRMRERQGHADAQELLQRHRAALSRLKTHAATVGAELEALRQRHETLLRAAESRQAEAALPMVLPAGLDISTEVCALFEHVARVARAIRPYSAFNRGHLGPEPRNGRYDLHWLSDCLHSFDQFGNALARGSLDALAAACRELLTMYELYPADGSGYDSRAAFQRLRDSVPLAPAGEALRAILGKIATLQAAHADEPVEADSALQQA